MPRRVTSKRVVMTLAGATAALAIAFASLSSAKTQSSSVRATQASAGPVVGLISGAAEWSQPSQRLNTILSHTKVKWVREGFFWYKLEPKSGRFNFRHYDQFMLLAARRHVHVLALLYQAPRWAAPAQNAVPSNPSAYAAFVAAVVHRYGPNGTLWAHHQQLRPYAVTTFDLWNEPYYDNGSAGRYDPARYARLVRAAATAGRAADGSARFLLAAEMQGTMISGHRWLWWVDAMYRAVPDLNRYFDGISVHPYGHDITHRSPAIVGQAYFGYDQMRRVEIIRSEFVQHGAANKPFWATEVGWPTCRGGSNRCVSTRGQVASLRAMVYYSKTIWASYMRAVFVYYSDDQRGSRSDSENDYGLTYVNHAAKPALSVFRSFARSAQTNPW
jgi:polysaccharide biosynthesis protein PslG